MQNKNTKETKKIDLHPKKCNICGGLVIYTNNNLIYGKSYGSGKCYLCTQCGSYVGTHEPRPTEALGLLADSQMRTLKKKCHFRRILELWFQWKTKKISEKYGI